MRALLLISAVSFVLSVCRCGGPEGPEQYFASAESCQPGLIYCDGNDAKVCGDSGKVVSKIRCAESTVCIDGTCSENTVCQSGQRICVNRTLKQCNSAGTDLVDQEICAGVCAGGLCVEPSNVCPNNVSYCEANSVYQCNSDGSGHIGNPINCGDGLCVDGACLPLVCSAGRAECLDNTARTCNALGTGYSVHEQCTGSQACIMGRCQESVCSPGLSCVDAVLVTCNSDGTQIVKQEDCAPATCSNGACVGASSDAGIQDDAASPDAWVNREDPNCGGPAQPCCAAGSSQVDDCDHSGLSCHRDFPNSGDAYCWSSCTPIPCTTLEGGSGSCRVATDHTGVCLGNLESSCSLPADCTASFGDGTCVNVGSSGTFCLATGCNFTAGCSPGFFCSPTDNNLCLALSMLQ